MTVGHDYRQGTAKHDPRSMGATDKEDAEGIRAANALLDHTTEAQTAAYIRRNKTRRVGAVR